MLRLTILWTLLYSIPAVGAVEFMDHVSTQQMATALSRKIISELKQEVGQNPPLLVTADDRYDSYDLQEMLKLVFKYELKTKSARYTELLIAIPKFAKFKSEKCSIDGRVYTYYESKDLSEELCGLNRLDWTLLSNLRLKNGLDLYKPAKDFDFNEAIRLFKEYGETPNPRASDLQVLRLVKIKGDTTPSEIRQAVYGADLPEFESEGRAIDAFFGDKKAGLREYILRSKSIRRIYYFGDYSGSGDWLMNILILVDEAGQVLALEMTYG